MNPTVAADHRLIVHSNMTFDQFCDENHLELLRFAGKFVEEDRSAESILNSLRESQNARKNWPTIASWLPADVENWIKAYLREPAVATLVYWSDFAVFARQNEPRLKQKAETVVSNSGRVSADRWVNDSNELLSKFVEQLIVNEHKDPSKSIWRTKAPQESRRLESWVSKRMEWNLKDLLKPVRIGGKPATNLPDEIDVITRESPGDVAVLHELHLAVREALAQLPKIQQIIVERVVIDGIPRKVVAIELGITYEQARRHHEEACAALRTRLRHLIRFKPNSVTLPDEKDD